MPQIIDVPDVGHVEFPDSMGDDDIIEAIKRLRPVPPSLQAVTSLPSPSIQVVAPERFPQELSRQREDILGQTRFRPGETPPTPPGLFSPFVPLPEAPRFTQPLSEIPLGAYPSLAASSLWNAVVKPTTEFFESPGGVASAGAASMGPLAARLVAAGFTTDLARNLPQVAREAGRLSVEGTPQESLEANLGLGAQMGFAGTTGYGTFHPGIRAEVPVQRELLGLRPFSGAVEEAAAAGGRGPRQLGISLARWMEQPGVPELIDRALQESQIRTSLTGLPGQEAPALEQLGKTIRGTGVVGDLGGTTRVERPGGGAPIQGQVSFGAPAEVGAIPSARQAAIGTPGTPVGEHPLITQVRRIATTKDRLELEELRRSIAGEEPAAVRRPRVLTPGGRSRAMGGTWIEGAEGPAQVPGLAVKYSTDADLLRLIDARLDELQTGNTYPELDNIRETLSRPQPEPPKPSTAVEVKPSPASQQQIGGPNAPRIRSDQGPVRQEGLQPEGGQTPRSPNIQQQSAGQKEPGVSGVQGQVEPWYEGRDKYLGDRPATPAVRAPTGEIFEGNSHQDAQNKAVEAGKISTTTEDTEWGWIGADNKFYPYDDIFSTPLPESLKEGGISGEAAPTVQPSGAEGVGEPPTKVPGITIPEPGKKGQEAGGFVLPGPELVRTVSGFAKDAKVAGQQMLNRLRNILHPGEFKAYDDAGLRVFLSRPRTKEEVAGWMQENGPRVEIRTVGEGSQTPEQKAAFGYRHSWYDSLKQKSQSIADGYVNNVTHPDIQYKILQQFAREEGLTEPKAKEQLDKWVQYRDVRGSDAAHWSQVSPKPESEMKDYVEGFVQVPVKDKLAESPNTYLTAERSKEAGVIFPGNTHTGGLPNALGWFRGYMDKDAQGRKVFHIVEVQSDWARHKRDVEQEVGKGRFSKQEDHPLLDQWERLVLKAAIDHAIKEGAERVAMSDAETAMMTEGQDQTVRYYARKGFQTPEALKAFVRGLPEDVKPYVKAEYHNNQVFIESLAPDRVKAKATKELGFLPELSQEPGMRLHYDANYHITDKQGNILGTESFPDPQSAHSFAKNRTAGLGLREGTYEVHRGSTQEGLAELTGEKGEVVDFGEHKMALETRSEAVPFGGPQPVRSNLIFRNPDGTSKTTATALSFDLGKVKSQGKDWSLFGSDKMKEPTGGGMQIKLGERPEAGAAILPPILKKVVDALTPKSREAITDAEIRTATGGPVIMFRRQDVEQKIATSPQGIGRIPGLAQIFDPRASAKDPVMRAILTGQSMRAKASNIATLFLEATKVMPRAFLADKQGRITMTDGNPGFISDVIEGEIRHPGSQLITTDQRAFINTWRVLRRGLVDYAQSEGIRSFVDDAGNIIPLSRDYFPRPAYGKVGYEETRSISHTSPGTLQFPQRERYYETEAQGRVSGGIKYEPDAYVRIAKWMEAVYKAIADERLSNDPALQGRPMGQGRARFLEEGGTFVPIGKGKIFPKEVADKINKYYGAQPHSATKVIAQANDFLKAFKFTMDVSAPFNQGLLMMSRFPIRWAHATLRSYATLLDTNQLSKYLQQGTRMEDAKMFVDNGGSLGSLQDFLIGARRGALATRVPVAGPIIRRSAESMNTFLSIGKLEMFRAMKDTVPARRIPELVEAVENTILSGRMESIGLTPARATAERILFNAPSYIRGAAGVLATAIRSGGLPAQALGTLAGALTLTMLGLYKGSGMSEEEIKSRFTPGNQKFLRYPLRLANGDLLETGPGNIITQIARLIGNSVDIAAGEKKMGSGVQGNPLLRWLSYRGSPIVQLAAQIYTGKDYLGRDISAKEAVARSVAPISAEQFVGREKPGTKATEAAFQVFGVSTFPESYTSTQNRLLDEAGQRKYGKNYSQLNPAERARVSREITPAMDTKREEVGPASMEFIGRQQQLRQERLVERLPKEQLEFLERNKLKVPGYQADLTIFGQRTTLTDDEKKTYEGILATEYSKGIKRLMTRPNFDSLKPLHKQELLKLVLDDARERSRMLLQREIRQKTVGTFQNK